MLNPQYLAPQFPSSNANHLTNPTTTMNGLPTKENFIRDNVAPVSCGICREDFDKNHTPVQLETCKHVFGHHCILNWFETDRTAANTCPSCRTVLFQADGATTQNGGNDPFGNPNSDNEDAGRNYDDENGGYNYDLDYDENAYGDDDIESSVLAGRPSREAEGDDDSGTGPQENGTGEKNDDELEDENVAWLVQNGAFDQAHDQIASSNENRRPASRNCLS